MCSLVVLCCAGLAVVAPDEAAPEASSPPTPRARTDNRISRFIFSAPPRWTVIVTVTLRPGNLRARLDVPCPHVRHLASMTSFSQHLLDWPIRPGEPSPPRVGSGDSGLPGTDIGSATLARPGRRGDRPAHGIILSMIRRLVCLRPLWSEPVGRRGQGQAHRPVGEDAHLVVRYQGGHNAGHTIVVDGETFALQLIPSGSSTTMSCRSSATVSSWSRRSYLPSAPCCRRVGST